MIVLKGLGSSAIITQGYMLSIISAVVARAPKYLLHGFNKRRTLQSKGRFQGRRKRR